MVKKEVFEWIWTGQKTIELRRGKAKKGDVAVFQCESYKRKKLKTSNKFFDKMIILLYRRDL